MLESVRMVLEQSPLLALFAVIGIGYALGQISIAGFSLGVGAVLFAGLAVGAIAPKATPPGLVSSIGLAMFLYGVGIQYGRQFFAGLRGPGLKWNLLGVIGVFAALAIALALGGIFGVSPAYSIGLFAGSMTSTPALQAAIDAAGNRDPAIGYSIAYPLGVVGPILCLYAFSRLYKSRVAQGTAPPQPLEITLDGAGATSVAEVTARLPPGVHLVAIRKGDANSLPDPHVRLSDGDGVLLFGSPEALEQARLALGRHDPGRLANDRGELDVVRVFVSRAEVVGTPLGRFHFPDGLVARVAEVRRGDAVLLPAPDLVLEYRGPGWSHCATRCDAGRAQVLRRFAEVDGGVLLRVGRPGDVARRAARSRQESQSRAWARSRSVLPAARSSSLSSWDGLAGAAPCPGTCLWRRISRSAVSG